MKIAKVRTRPVRAAGDARAACLVELLTGDGVRGTGFGPQSSAKTAVRLAEGLLIGEDPRATVSHWQRLAESFGEGRTGGEARAAAILDTALWDLRAKLDGEPLWRALGGARPRANACASLPSSGLSHREWLPGEADLRGFRSCRLALGGDNDRERLAALREGLEARCGSPDMLLAVPGGWSANRLLSELGGIEQEFDIVMVETALDDPAGLDRVRRGVYAALCPAQAPFEAQGLFARGEGFRFDAVKIDPSFSGVTGSLQIAEAAYGYELPVVLEGGPGLIGAHLAAAMPNVAYLAVAVSIPQSGPLETGAMVRDGWVVAGDEAGHGISAGPGQGGEPS